MRPGCGKLAAVSARPWVVNQWGVGYRLIEPHQMGCEPPKGGIRSGPLSEGGRGQADEQGRTA